MIAFIKQLINWIGRLFRWLMEKKRLYFSIFAVPVIIIFCCLIFNNAEKSIRISGLLLQLMGLGAVVWGIYDIRKLFGKPSVSKLFHDWVNRLPKFKPKSTPILVQPGYVTASASIDGIIIGKPKSDSIAERVEELEKGLIEARAMIKEAQNNIKEESRKQAQELKNEQRERETEDLKIVKLLEESVAGGLSLEVMGVFWLFAGITCATIPKEILTGIKIILYHL